MHSSFNITGNTSIYNCCQCQHLSFSEKTSEVTSIANRNIIYHHTRAEKYFKKSKLNDNLCALFFKYAEENKSKWKEKIKESDKDCLIIKPSESDLPFTIEYFKDGNWMVHTKRVIGRGATKEVFFSVDLEHHSLWARKKFYSEKEMQLTQSFEGNSGIVQMHHITPSTKREGKYRVIEELYDRTLAFLETKDLTIEEMKIVATGLLEGLVAIHAKGFLFYDLKPANILVRICPKTNKVIKVVLCDLGSVTAADGFLDFTAEQTQRMELDWFLELITKLYNTHKMLKCPEFISSLRYIPDNDFLREKGILPRDAATALEALKAFNKYYSS